MNLFLCLKKLPWLDLSVIDITMQSQSLQAVLYNPKPLIFTGLVYYVSVKIFSYFAKKLELRMSKND